MFISSNVLKIGIAPYLPSKYAFSILLSYLTLNWFNEKSFDAPLSFFSTKNISSRLTRFKSSKVDSWVVIINWVFESSILKL